MKQTPKPEPLATSRAGQHNDENGPFEVFFVDTTMINNSPSEGWKDYEPGWYWWSCSPGCLPDGEAQGPFDSSEAAYNSAKDLDFSYNKGGL